MEIKTDLSAITRKSALIVSEGGDVRASGLASGLSEGNTIYISPATLLGTLGIYCHEVGHVLGDYYSFQAGLHGEESDVLSIDEVKAEETTIELMYHEQDYLLEHVFSDDVVQAYEVIVFIANKLLTVFTKGKFNPDSISCRFVTQEELDNIVNQGNIRTVGTDGEGKSVYVNSRGGRNDELPAVTAELCCMQILENTLRRYHVYGKRDFITYYTSTSPAHQRAQNLVARAFDRTGWRLPSARDMKAKKAA